ncbi:MAG TPA: hypothetical protein VJ161_06360 [Geobacteraceae bacterium]|nr:hypothetical protein [Geobacteraceae bacterium]
MNIWKICLMVIVINFSGTVLAYAAQLNTTAKTGLVLMQNKNIAVIKFKTTGTEPPGQEAADILALGFVKQGFNVVGGSQIAGLIDQDEVNTFGLSPEIKAKLKSSGIDAIVLGTVNEYYCSYPGRGPWLRRTDSNNRCSVTVSANMLNLDSGEIVWGVTHSDNDEGKWTTAESVLRSVMQNIQTTIPSVFTPVTSSTSTSGGKQQPPPAAGTAPGKPAHIKQ